MKTYRRIAALALLIAVLMVCGVGGAINPITGSVAEYYFSTGNGSILVDSSAGAHNGTLVNFPNWTSQGLSFNSPATQYVTIPNFLNTGQNGTNLSVFMVVKTNTGGSSGLFSHWVSFGAAREWSMQSGSPATTLNIILTGDGSTQHKTYSYYSYLNTGNYSMLGFTYAPNNLTAYSRNVSLTPSLKIADVNITSLYTPTSPLLVGTLFTNVPASPATETMAYAVIYNRTLNASEITSLYSYLTPIMNARGIDITGSGKVLKYYAYGASITSTIDPICYLLQMQATHDPLSLADHNVDGFGKTSAWLLSGLAGKYETVNPEYMFIDGGYNDKGSGIAVNTTIDNLITMYNYSQSRGSTPYIILTSGADFWVNEYVPLIRTNLTARNIPYVYIGDAVDQIPNDGIAQSIQVPTYSTDGSHPNSEGQRLMGELLWAYLNNQVIFASFTPAGPVISLQYPNGQAFVDTSTGGPTDWYWDFGDGVTSTLQNPTHVWSTAGIFIVSLNASNAYSYSTNSTTVTVFKNDFYGTPTSGTAPLSVAFTDLSTNSTTWNWSFGDGGTSILQNPTYIYLTPGTYTVSSTITNAGGSNITTFPNYISVSVAPTPSPTPTPTPGPSPSTNMGCGSTSFIPMAFNLLGIGLIVVGIVGAFVTAKPAMNYGSTTGREGVTNSSTMLMTCIGVVVGGAVLLTIGIVMISPIIGVTCPEVPYSEEPTIIPMAPMMMRGMSGPIAPIVGEWELSYESYSGTISIYSDGTGEIVIKGYPTTGMSWVQTGDNEYECSYILGKTTLIYNPITDAIRSPDYLMTVLKRK